MPYRESMENRAFSEDILDSFLSVEDIDAKIHQAFSNLERRDKVDWEARLAARCDPSHGILQQ